MRRCGCRGATPWASPAWNHAVLYVRDAELSAHFYAQVLGFVEVSRMASGRACRPASSCAAQGARLQEVGGLIGRSDHTTSKALYASDPDGLEFEVCWVVPPELLHEHEPKMPTVHELDLGATIDRFGCRHAGLGYPRS